MQGETTEQDTSATPERGDSAGVSAEDMSDGENQT